MSNIRKNIKRVLKEYTKELNILLEDNNIPTVPSPIGPTRIQKQMGFYGASRGGGRKHRGIDLNAESGTEIRSPFNGVVIEADRDKKNACGGVIYINHKELNLKTRYCHCKEVNVKTGDKVTKGEIIGRTGGDKKDEGRGNSSVPHLHFELYHNGVVIDPTNHLDYDADLSKNINKMHGEKYSHNLEGFQNFLNKNLDENTLNNIKKVDFEINFNYGESNYFVAHMKDGSEPLYYLFDNNTFILDSNTP